MTFAAPALLLGLLLVPLALVVYRIVPAPAQPLCRSLHNVDLLGNLVPRTPAWRRHVPPALYLGAIAALVLALAAVDARRGPREQATIILTMDVSGSMKAVDVAPQRLAAAQKAASDFIDQLPSTFKVGLVAFSTAAADRGPADDRPGDPPPGPVQSPGAGWDRSRRCDHDVARGRRPRPVERILEPDPVAERVHESVRRPLGLGDACSLRLWRHGSTDKPVVATVLLSDGKQSTGDMEPIPAAEQAAALGVPVYTIALGTATGSSRSRTTRGTRTSSTSRRTRTPWPRSPRRPAAGSSRHRPPRPRPDLPELGSRIGYTNEEQEVTQWFAAAGLLLVVTGAGLAAHWFKPLPVRIYSPFIHERFGLGAAGAVPARRRAGSDHSALRGQRGPAPRAAPRRESRIHFAARRCRCTSDDRSDHAPSRRDP